jgi:hypothetical protein
MMKKVFLSLLTLCSFLGAEAQLTFRTLGSSGNAFSILDPNVTALSVNNTLGTIVLIHRTNGKLFTSDDQNHGEYRYDVSKDKGTNWVIDKGVLNPSGTESGKACRFPNGVIHNKVGNTNADSAYLVYFGTFHQGGSIPAGSPTWIRNTHGRARLNHTGFTDQTYRPSFATTGKDIGVASSLVNGKKGEFWCITEVDSPLSANTVRLDTFIYVNKGVWQEGPDTVAWSSIKLLSNFRDIDLVNFTPKIVFSADKKYGYVTFIGDYIGNGMFTMNYYKSSDSGANWSTNYTSVDLHKVVGIDTTAEAGLKKIQIFDYAPAVDTAGNLHFAAITGIEDPANVQTFVTENNTDENTRIYYIGNDPSNPASCRWYAYDMGRINKIRGNLASGSAGTYTGTNRLQSCISPDGLNAFFSWVDNFDPNSTDLAKPNLRTFGVSMSSKKISKIKEITKGDIKFGDAAFQFKTSAEALENNDGTVELPYVVISFKTPNSANSDDEITYYYLDNVNFKKSDIKYAIQGPRIKFASLTSDTLYIKLNASNVPVFTYPAYIKSRVGCTGVDTVPGAIVDTPKFLPTANGAVGFISYRIILGGDTDMVTVPVMAFNDPVVNFTYTVTNNSVKFTNTSDAGKYRITKWLWNLSQAPTSTLKELTRVYTQLGTYPITLTGTNELTGASGSKRDTVKIITLSVLQNEGVNNSIKMYPNPASDKVNLTVSETYDQFNVSIIDVAGNRVFVERQYGKTNGKLQINVSTLPEGQYLLMVDTEDGFSVKKLTIRK